MTSSWLNNLKRSTRWQIGFLAILSLCTFFFHNGSLEPDIMEARNYITAREMLNNGHWLTPTMNGEYRLAKPPLPTWVTAAVGKMVGNINNLSALRIPAGIMGMIMVLSLFGLVRIMSREKLLPLLASAVLCTSFYVLFMARKGTWDIYCHSFMLAAIWALVRGLKSDNSSYKWFIFSGLLLGLSFMSKGPVSFYAILLPFLLAYIITFGSGEFKTNHKGLLLCLGVGVLVGSSWPLYVYLNHPDELMLSVATETGSWQNRHIRPFWHYWSFPVQSGVWTIFIIVSLIPGYAKRRVQSAGGNYKFLLLWVVLTILLLSLIPEKKERYLMPGQISQAFLVAYILHYFIVQANSKLTRVDKVILNFNLVFLAVICLASPVVLYQFAFVKGWVPLSQLVGFSLVLFLFGVLMIVYIKRRKNFSSVILIFIMSGILCAWIPAVFRNISKEYPPKLDAMDIVAFDQWRDMNWYSIGRLRPEEIWDLDKIVRPVNSNQLDSLSKPSLLFIEGKIQEGQEPQPVSIDSMEYIGRFQHRSNHRSFWQVHIFDPKAGVN